MKLYFLDDNDNPLWFLVIFPLQIITHVFSRKQLSDREKMVKYLKKQARKETRRLPF